MGFVKAKKVNHTFNQGPAYYFIMQTEKPGKLIVDSGRDPNHQMVPLLAGWDELLYKTVTTRSRKRNQQKGV